MKTIFRYMAVALAAVAMAACNEKGDIYSYEVEPPVIENFTPSEGEVGTEITICGENLTRVDTVLIGDAPAQLKYRISENKIVVEVSSASRSGKITVSNSAGTYTTEESFTINYRQPSIPNYPTEATVYDQVVVEGENLHFITSVMLGDDTVNIVAQRSNELVFEVPFHEDETPVTLRFTYFDGKENKAFGPEGATFTILKLKPVISVCPDSLTKYTPVTIEGEHLDLIEALYIGDVKAEIRLQNESMIEFDIPSDYFGGPFSGDLKAIYYGTKEMVIKPAFLVISDPREKRFTLYENITLSARVASGGTENAFLDGDQGIVYSSCDVEDNMMDIDFFLYDNSGYAQFYSPSNATNTLKNFKCEGVSITSANPDAWSASTFYGTACLFKILDPNTPAQLAVINAYEADTIVALDSTLFAGISEPSTKAPRIYATDADGASYTSGHLTCETYRYAWVKNFNTGKNGIIKLKSAQASTESGKTHTVTFDLIWSK